MKWNFLLCVCTALCLLQPVQAAPGNDNDGIKKKAATLFKQDDYAGLETLVGGIKQRGYDISQIYPELSAFYHALELKSTDSERQWLDQQTKLDGWAKAFPDSLSAKVAMADWFIGYAWKARGTGYAHTVTDEGWKLMSERLNQAANILRSVPPEKVDDPEYYRHWITLAVGDDSPNKAGGEAFAKGAQVAKEFYPLYSTRAYFLLPRWFGKSGEWEKFAEEASATFLGEKRDILYAQLAQTQARFYGESFFQECSMDYDRIKSGLLASAALEKGLFGNLSRLCYLAAIQGDKETARRLFLDLGSNATTRSFGELSDFIRLRKASGAAEAVEAAEALEQAGNLAEAEKALASFHPEAPTSPWLFYFYMRQGMEPKLRKITLLSDGFPIPKILDTSVAEANPDILANLSRICPQLGDWDKAEAAGREFNQKRPWNLTGKLTLWLCALHKGDRQQAEALRQEIAALKTDRPNYQAAQAILSGGKTWDDIRGELIPPAQDEQAASSDGQSAKEPGASSKKFSQYLCQSITAITLHYLSKGDAATAQAVIKESLPACPDNPEKALLTSLLYGSVARSLKVQN